MEKLNYSEAQDYCSNNLTKFNATGSLAGFQSDSDWKNISDLITTIENADKNAPGISGQALSKRKYWVGLKCQSETESQCDLGDGTKNINPGHGDCFALGSVDGRTYRKLTRSNCSETKYFVCNITKFSSEGIIIFYVIEPRLISILC
jgi:hypothetical protein